MSAAQTQESLSPYDQFKIDHPGEKPLVSWACAYCVRRTVAPKWKDICGNCGAPYTPRYGTDIVALSGRARPV
jgi:hypothetical protein